MLWQAEYTKLQYMNKVLAHRVNLWLNFGSMAKVHIQGSAFPDEIGKSPTIVSGSFNFKNDGAARTTHHK